MTRSNSQDEYFTIPVSVPQAYNWTQTPDMVTEEKKENINRPHMQLRLRGDEIQAGDYVESELSGSGAIKRNWSVVAERGRSGLGWRFVGNMTLDSEHENRWTADRTFKIRRFHPEKNEFGEVKP